MADKKWSELPAAAALTGAEISSVVQGGANVQVPVSKIAALAPAPTQIVNDGGSVVVSAAGAITITPGVGQVLTTTRVVLAIGGMTVGQGMAAPSVPGRFRIDQTDALNGYAVLEFFNGTDLSGVYLEANSAGARFVFSNDVSIKFQTQGGTQYALFGADSSFSLSYGKLTATSTGVVKASGGVTIGAGISAPSAGRRLRLDQTDAGLAAMEFFNGTTTSYVYNEPGGFHINEDVGVSFQNTTVGAAYAKFNNSHTFWLCNGNFQGTAAGDISIGGKVGFYGTAPAAKPTVTGSRGGNAALASLLTAGATLGLWTDSTTA